MRERETNCLPVTPFVVIPGDKFHEGFAQPNPSICIEDTWPSNVWQWPLYLRTKLDFEIHNPFQDLSVRYLESPRKSLETTSSSVYPRMPLSGPSEANLLRDLHKSQLRWAGSSMLCSCDDNGKANCLNREFLGVSITLWLPWRLRKKHPSQVDRLNPQQKHLLLGHGKPFPLVFHWVLEEPYQQPIETRTNKIHALNMISHVTLWLFLPLQRLLS